MEPRDYGMEAKQSCDPKWKKLVPRCLRGVFGKVFRHFQLSQVRSSSTRVRQELSTLRGALWWQVLSVGRMYSYLGDRPLGMPVGVMLL